MIDRPLVYPFYEEAHLRRGRSVQRPVVLVSIGDPQLTFEALVDSGSEHVLADSTLAMAAGIDLSDLIDVQEIGLGGGIVEARFMPVTEYLHPPGLSTLTRSRGISISASSTERPLYPCILGNVGFLDRFTISRFAQATAVEALEAFYARFGTS